jgi:hypothetical protein
MKRFVIWSLVTLLILSAVISQIALAENQTGDYQLLAPLTPAIGPTVDSGDVSGYVISLYYIFIGLSGVLAVLVIVVGGFMYISSDSITGKTNGRTWVKNALLGLLLVLGSAIILQTINPNILKLSNLGLSRDITAPPIIPVDGINQVTNSTKYYRTTYVFEMLGTNKQERVETWNDNYDLCLKDLTLNLKKQPRIVQFIEECKEYTRAANSNTTAPPATETIETGTPQFYFTYKDKRGIYDQGPFPTMQHCNASLTQVDIRTDADDSDIINECSLVADKYCFTFKNKDEEKRLCFLSPERCTADRNWIDGQTEAKDNLITRQCIIR